jgi:hypothetical protein
MLASILGVCALFPMLKELESRWRQDPRLMALLEKDAARDRSDLIASWWMASAQQLLLKRGLALPAIDS